MFKKIKWSKATKDKNIDINKRISQDEYIKSLIEVDKLPLVVLDPSWYEMKKTIQSQELLNREKILNEFIKEQGKLTTDTQEYERVKQNLLQKVLQLSEEVQGKQEERKLSELEKMRQTVLKTNEIIESNEKRLEELEILINRANRELVEEAVRIGYTQMEDYRLHKQALEKEIDELRKQVVLKTEEKKAYEKKFGVTYNYLHKVMGYKYIDKVDSGLGDQKE